MPSNNAVQEDMTGQQVGRLVDILVTELDKHTAACATCLPLSSWACPTADVLRTALAYWIARAAAVTAMESLAAQQADQRAWEARLRAESDKGGWPTP